MKKGFNKLAMLFRELEIYRQGRWYGSKGNGEVSQRVLDILDKIKELGGIW